MHSYATAKLSDVRLDFIGVTPYVAEVKISPYSPGHEQVIATIDATIKGAGHEGNPAEYDERYQLGRQVEIVATAASMRRLAESILFALDAQADQVEAARNFAHAGRRHGQ